MVLPAKVKNGVIILDDGRQLPDGIPVSVTVPDCTAVSESPNRRTLFERLHKVVGKAEGGATDGSNNIDHYLYGQLKR